MEYAEKSKAIRKETGWNQTYLGKLIGSTQSEISSIERGFIPLDLSRIEKIAKLYEVICEKKKRLYP